MILLGALFAWLMRAVMVDPVPIEVDPIPPDPFDPTALDPGNTFEYPPSWLPEVSGTEPFTGSGARPVWDDVYNYAEAKFNERYAAGLNLSDDVRNGGGLDIGRTAIGSTLRAVSGFINQTVETMQRQFSDVYRTLQFVLTGLDDTNRAQDVRIHNLQNEVNGLSFIAAAEERQINALRENIFDAAQFTTAYLQDWVTHHVTEPLLRAIVEEQQHRDAAILRASRSVLDQSHNELFAAVAPLAIGAAAASRAITALQTESDNCVKPMCETMGPNTNLGKLLKGLNLALDAAALADLLALTAPELADELATVITKIGGYIADFEGYFTDGSETLGSVLGNVTGGLL